MSVDITVSFLIVFQSLAIMYDLHCSRSLRQFEFHIILGYLLRLFFLYFDLYGRSFFTLPNSGADSEDFFMSSVAAAGGLKTNRTMLPVVMGYIYRFTGVNRLYGQYLLLLCSVLSICVFAIMLQMLHIERSTCVRAVGIISLLPNFAILSSVYLRESIVSMFLTLSLLLFVIWMRTGKEVLYLLSFIFVLAGAVFHSGALALGAGFIIIRILFDQKTGQLHARPVNVLTALSLLLVLWFLYTRYQSVVFDKILRIDDIGDIANVNEKGGSSYAAYVGDSSSALNIIRYSMPRMLYFRFSPFPWQWRGIRDIATFAFSSVFYLAAVCETIWHMLKKGRNRAVLFLFLIMAVVCDFVFGWGTANVGTAIRHRDKTVILFGLLWALGHDGNRNMSLTLGGHILF